jgi:DNA-binding response OmpR family regulator
MPLAELEDETTSKLLLVGLDATLAAALSERLPESEGFKFEAANSGFEAGVQAEALQPDCIIIDLKLGRNEAMQIAQNLRKKSEYHSLVLIALVGAEDFAGDGLTQQGFDEVFRKPFDVALLGERIRRRVAERKNII